MNDKVKVLFLASNMTMFWIGVLLGSFSNQPNINSVNAWLDTKSITERYDFIDARLDASMRRQIAEDWCLQNPNTIRVCHNATKYSRPVK